MTKLTKLAEQWLKEGKSLDYVRKYLSDYGYKKRDIDQALQEAQFLKNTRKVSKPKHDPHGATAMLVILLVIISITALLVIRFTDIEEPIPTTTKDVKTIDIRKTEIVQTFQNTNCETINLQSEKEKCLMNLIQQGNDHLCAQIQLPENRKYCERIERIQLLSEY